MTHHSTWSNFNWGHTFPASAYCLSQSEELLSKRERERGRVEQFGSRADSLCRVEHNYIELVTLSLSHHLRLLFPSQRGYIHIPIVGCHCQGQQCLKRWLVRIQHPTWPLY